MVWKRAIAFNWSVITCLILSSSANVIDRKSNFNVFELEPRSESQWTLVRSFEKQNSYVFLNDLDNRKIGLLVAPEEISQLEQKLSDVDMKFRVFRSSDQTELEMKPGEEYNWNQYHKLNDTYNWLRSLSKLYPQQASLFVAGKSYEGRDLLGIKISYGDFDKKAIFIEGGIHAREWISPATATYIANQLLTSQDRDVRMIAENFDWYILPHVNPDGYIYTYTTDRLWRKSRSPQANGCYGVDLNRNWDFHWNEVGVSSDPCDITYAGPKPFSEIEVRTLANYINKLKSKLFLYVSFHSYRGNLLYPYGYTPELPPNNLDLKRVYDAAIAGFTRRYGNQYTGGNIYDSMYPASGTGTDWVYAVAGINYSFVYELCPSHSSIYGFKLPADRIIPTGEETLDSLVEMVKEASVEHNAIASSIASGAQHKKFTSAQLFLFFWVFFIDATAVIYYFILSIIRI